MKLVSEIITEACAHLGQAAPSNFTSTSDQDQLIMKSKFQYWYRDLLNKQPEDFKKEVDITTVAGQQAYSFPGSLQSLDISELTNVRYISPNAFSSWQLQYYSEKDIERMFPKPDDIPQGQVTGWWINTNNTSGSKELRFYLTPNDAYTIRFYLNEIPSNLAWTDMTVCNRWGDEYLTSRMVAELCRHWFGDEDMKTQKAELETEQKWNAYLLRKWHNNEHNTYIAPHTSNYGLQYTDVNPRY